MATNDRMPGATPIHPQPDPNDGRMVVIPRSAFDKYREMDFAGVKAAAERGDDGIAFATKDCGAIWLREGQKHEGTLYGKALVWFQGWV